MDTATHTLAEREPVRIGALLLAAWGIVIAALAWAGVEVPDAFIGAVTAFLALAGGEAVRARAWAPATVEDLGVLDADEDPTDPDAVQL